MEEKKKFECPEAIIVDFNDEDIILTSGPGAGMGQGYDDWIGGN